MFLLGKTLIQRRNNIKVVKNIKFSQTIFI